MDDRRVHARGTGVEVVRYDRSGKWYVEGTGGRRCISVAEAARIAYALACSGGELELGVPGGAAFDREVGRA